MKKRKKKQHYKKNGDDNFWVVALLTAAIVILILLILRSFGVVMFSPGPGSGVDFFSRYFELPFILFALVGLVIYYAATRKK
ncbi:MAG: hypothetical protein ABIH92_05690 [Nanoarchaeota archaeon]